MSRTIKSAMRRELEKVLPSGWRIDGLTSSGHYRLVHDDTQIETVFASSTPSAKSYHTYHVLKKLRHAEREAKEKREIPKVAAKSSLYCARCGEDYHIDKLGAPCGTISKGQRAPLHDWKKREEEPMPTETETPQDLEALIAAQLKRDPDVSTDALYDLVQRRHAHFLNGMTVRRFGAKVGITKQRLAGPYLCRFCEREFGLPGPKGKHESDCDQRPSKKPAKKPKPAESKAKPEPKPEPAESRKSVEAETLMEVVGTRPPASAIRALLIEWTRTYEQVTAEEDADLLRVVEELDAATDVIFETFGFTA